MTTEPKFICVPLGQCLRCGCKMGERMSLWCSDCDFEAEIEAEGWAKLALKPDNPLWEQFVRERYKLPPSPGRNIVTEQPRKPLQVPVRMP
ncbi:MAG: hypothetical protein IT462_11520 [Planctomycetes bacterium]|nr:hypothetical protein [Planctomycetota bacterium]